VPKVSQQYRDARREQILAAGRRCFLRDGFHATSMQDLFTESGLSSGAVYRYFAGKDELIIAIAEDNMRDVVALIQGLVVDHHAGSIGDALAEVLVMVERKHAESGLGGLAVQVWAEALRNADVARRFGLLLRQLRVDLATVVAHHQAAGHLSRDVAPTAVAGLLISTVAGQILQTALFGPATGAELPDAARALWPAKDGHRRS
jgi:TetR/AcrR family transcriptional regulator, transcriptional repressor of aconitase